MATAPMPIGGKRYLQWRLLRLAAMAALVVQELAAAVRAGEAERALQLWLVWSAVPVAQFAVACTTGTSQPCKRDNANTGHPFAGGGHTQGTQNRQPYQPSWTRGGACKSMRPVLRLPALVVRQQLLQVLVPLLLSQILQMRSHCCCC